MNNMRIDPSQKLHPCFALGYEGNIPLITPMEVMLLVFGWFVCVFIILVVILVVYNQILSYQ